MSNFASTTLNHLLAVSALVRGTRAQAVIDPITLGLDLRAGGRRIRFIPQFVFHDKGTLRYTPDFSDRVAGFIGWRPYFNKRWPIALDKLAFKRFCLDAGVPTPRFWPGALPAGHPAVIVKRRGGSFGEGIHGPYLAGESEARNVALAADEYAEEFIRGRAGKAWYWDGQLCAVEYCDPATITGDGRSTIAELLRAPAVGEARDLNRPLVDACLRLQGFTPETRPADGERITVDFRYAAPLAAIAVRGDGGSNFVREIDGTPAAAQLHAAGVACWEGIPAAIRAHSLFTLDFVEAADRSLHFLEMNCNPMVHPDVYPAMFRGVLGPFFGSEPEPMPGAPGPKPQVPGILEHLKALRPRLLALDARATIDAADLVLRIVAAGRTVHLQPRFLHQQAAHARVTHRMSPGINGFAGWLPCLARRWPFVECCEQREAFVRACGLEPAIGAANAQRAWFWNGDLLFVDRGEGVAGTESCRHHQGLAEVGYRLWRGLSSGRRIDTLFAVEVVHDPDGMQVANADPDPVVPPAVYPHLLSTLFAAPAHASAARHDRFAEISVT